MPLFLVFIKKLKGVVMAFYVSSVNFSFGPSFNKSSINRREKISEVETSVKQFAKGIIHKSKKFFGIVNPNCRKESGSKYNEWKEKVILGAKALSDVSHGIRSNDVEDQDIENIAWFLMAKSVSEKQAFDRGTIRVIDDENRLANFLFSRDGKKFRAKGAYSRKSSHFKKLQKKESTIGFDVEEERNLPLTEQKTILFGALKPVKMIEGTEEHPSVYLKFETEGCKNFADKCRHGVNYARHLFGKKTPPSTSTEKISGDLKEEGFAVESRREENKNFYRIYTRSKKALKKTLERLGGSYRKAKPGNRKCIAEGDIEKMYKNLKSLNDEVKRLRGDSKLSPDTEEFESFKKVYNPLIQFDETLHIPRGVRKGEEVLYRLEDLISE